MITKIDEIIEGKGWETRKKILEELTKKPATAYELSKRLDLNYSTVKYHLELLEKAGMITYNKDRRNRYFYEVSKNVNLLKIL
jgi:predicted transcriptional regulator